MGGGKALGTRENKLNRGQMKNISEITFIPSPKDTQSSNKGLNGMPYNSLLTSRVYEGWT